MTAHRLAWQRRAAVEAGRTWLAEIDDAERVLLDGQLVTAGDQAELAYPVLDYLVAEPGDAPSHIEYVQGKPVIHVSHCIAAAHNTEGVIT